MIRRDFTKLSFMGSAGMIVNPVLYPFIDSRKDNNEELLIWPWLGKLVVAAAVTWVTKKVLDYMLEKLTEPEQKEVAERSINKDKNHQYSSVYEYNKEKDNDFLFGKGVQGQKSPDEVHFYSKDKSFNNYRVWCAGLKAPELAGLTLMAENYKNEERQNGENIRNILLPRKVDSRGFRREPSPKTGTCIYYTRHAQLAIKYELDDPYAKSYWMQVEVNPSRPVKLTNDLRYKPRTLQFRDVMI